MPLRARLRLRARPSPDTARPRRTSRPRALGLAFRPLAVESDGLLVRATELARTEVVRLCEVAQRFLERVAAPPGDASAGCGTIHFDAQA